MSKRGSALDYAVRPRVVLKYLGQLLIVVAALTTAPLIVSFAAGEAVFTRRYAVVVLVLSGVGFLLARLRAAARIQTNEGLVVSASVFVLVPLAMIYPMAGSGMSFLDAFYESVSGVTTTGLTTLPAVEGQPLTFLFSRAWMQWYGGLGIVVLSLALLMPPGEAARQLSDRDGGEEDLLGGTKLRARAALRVYCALTAVALVALLAVGTAPLAAALHVLCAVSTGGFSSWNDSLAGFPAAARWILLVFSFAGALPLLLYPRVRRRGWREGVRDPQLPALLAAGAVASVAIVLALRATMGWSWPDSLRHGVLMAWSAQTTTGFSSTDVAGLAPLPKAILVLAMFVGGAAGSTAGGVKVLRLMVLLRVVQLMIRRTALPKHAVLEPRLAGRRIESDEVRKALTVTLLFALVVVLSWLPFLAEGHAPLDALFEVVSATGTVGLSTGMSASGLVPALKVVLCLDMLLGRVEMIALLVLLYPGTWIGRRSEEP